MVFCKQKRCFCHCSRSVFRCKCAFENGDEQAREQKIDEIIKLIDK